MERTRIVVVMILAAIATCLAVAAVRGRRRQWISAAAIASVAPAMCLVGRSGVGWPLPFFVSVLAVVSILTVCLGAAAARGPHTLWIVAGVITLLSIVASYTVRPFRLEIYSYYCGPLCGEGFYLNPAGIAGATLVGAATLSIRAQRVRRGVLLLLAGAAMCVVLVFFGFGRWIS